MKEMSAAQKRALELWLESAELQNNFTPMTERKLAERLQAEGYQMSDSQINRVKQKFGWKALLEAKVTASVSDSAEVVTVFENAGLESVIKNTKIDAQRVEILQASTHEAMEILMGRILKKLREGKELNKEETKTIIAIAQYSAVVKDKILERINNLGTHTISSDEIKKQLESVELEFEAEVIDE
ncbi:MAG: hypothetical protein LBF71_02730 [Campylobacteraceae bacterium]|jgi:hypothetical protein|nr:hypothetical protein [Campylobacteraceae bacterium]